MANNSMIARILKQIQDEYEAGVRGMSGFSQGTSRHDFITARMENMSRLHGDLATMIGAQKAAQMVSDRLENL